MRKQLKKITLPPPHTHRTHMVLRTREIQVASRGGGTHASLEPEWSWAGWEEGYGRSPNRTAQSPWDFGERHLGKAEGLMDQQQGLSTVAPLCLVNRLNTMKPCKEDSRCQETWTQLILLSSYLV